MKTRAQSGIVLLLALLILASVLATSLTVGSIVLRELRITHTSDRAVSAYYAAESGLEQGLYWWRADQKKGDELLVNSNSPKILSSNGASWWRVSQVTENQLLMSLKKDQSTQLDLFDIANPLNETSQVQSLVVSWDGNSVSCPGAGSEWLEVAWSGWKGGLLSNLNVERRYYSNSNVWVNGARQEFVINLPITSVGYRVRLKALFADVCDLRVTAYKKLDGGTEADIYPIPARLTINATGQLVNTRQSLSVTVPMYAPAADIFDFTIMSKCSILKGEGFADLCEK